MKKYGFFVALAIALLTAALVIGCLAPVEDGLGKAPEGMGYVMMNLNDDTNGRSVFLPSTTGFAQFASYQLVFTPSAATPGDAVLTTVVVTSADVNATTGVMDPIALNVGNYASVTVTAYKTGGTAGSSLTPATPGAAGTNPMATGSNTTAFSVSQAGPNVAVAITLAAYPISTTAQSGTFSWNIAKGFTEGVPSAASVTVRAVNASLPGTTPGTNTVNLYTGAVTTPWTSGTTPMTLASGYYFADFTLTVSSITKTFQHILYIYQNMDTAVALEFKDVHFGIVTIDHGDKGATFTYNPPTVNNPLTVSVDPSGVAPGATGDINDWDEPLVLTTGDELILTISNPTLVAADEVTWSINGTPITTSTAGAALSGTPDGQILTITAGSAPFGVSTTGAYELTVSAITDTPVAFLPNQAPLYFEVK